MLKDSDPPGGMNWLPHSHVQTSPVLSAMTSRVTV